MSHNNPSNADKIKHKQSKKIFKKSWKKVEKGVDKTKKSLIIG